MVLRNLKVLRAPDTPAPGSKLTGSFDQNYSTMLLMTDNQAQKYQWILKGAGVDAVAWHLALRPVVHDADSANHLDTLFSVFLADLKRHAGGR
jgi:hypothetical protein